MYKEKEWEFKLFYSGSAGASSPIISSTIAATEPTAAPIDAPNSGFPKRPPISPPARAPVASAETTFFTIRHTLRQKPLAVTKFPFRLSFQLSIPPSDQ